MVDGLEAYLPFLIEIDRLKLVERQSRLAGGGRRENSAEHSWHLALFALILGKDRPIDLMKAMKMLLIHDLVEIDAGDTPLHVCGRDDQFVAEVEAAHRIFGLLPAQLSVDWRTLWDEFELGESAEAKFCKAIDRLQPLILNLLNDGGTWAESGVSEEMVAQKYGQPISEAFPELWPEVWELVQRHFAGGSVIARPPAL